MDFVSDVVESLKDLSGSPWFYLIIFAGVVLDSVLPIMPSETLVIAGGVAAGLGDLNVGLVMLVAMGGAFIGDHLSYAVGRRASRWFLARAETRESTANRLRWASGQIRTRGGLLLVTARFVPAGRTVLTLSAGITRQALSWFATWVTIAVVIWGSYATLLGYIGGKAFEDNDTAAFLVAFGCAFGVTAISELWRAIRNRRLARSLRDEHGPEAADTADTNVPALEASAPVPEPGS